MKQIKNSIQPSIKETERFVLFLNKKFKLNLPNSVIINIQDTNKYIKGYFMCKEHRKHYENTKRPLNYICVSSHYLKDNPYETIAHEVGHFYNYKNRIKDTTVNQYHNKHFKEIAERLLLKVDYGTRGYAYTSVTPEFKKMLKSFKPNKKAFHVFQHAEEKTRSPNRNILFMCKCGTKVRTARNEEHPFYATCGYCNTPFREV